MSPALHLTKLRSRGRREPGHGHKHLATRQRLQAAAGRAAVRVRHWVVGLSCIAAGAAVATGLFAGVAAGPRIGIATALITLGCLVIGVPLSVWILRKTTRPADYTGNCPVGRVCPACEAFNMNPRTVCRVCRTDLAAGQTVGTTGAAAKEPL